MKFGLFVNAVVTDGAICHYDMCRHFEKAGHTMRFYGNDFEGNRDGVTTVKISAGEIQPVPWWKREALDMALLYGADRFDPSILQAAREAGTKLIIESDSDGYVSIRQDPLRVLRVNMWDPSYAWRHKAGIVKAWLQELLVESARREALLFKTFELADYIKIESEEPARLLREFLKRRNHAHLAEKVVTIPFAVRNIFVTEPVNLRREDLVIVAGRLGAQQKNPALLERALRRFLDASPAAHIEMHVRGDAPNLETLAASHPRVQLFKQTASHVLCKRLASARVLVSASRHESTPVQGLEALCQGCTLVASDDVPGYRSLIQNGAYGETYRRNSADDFASAIQRELGRWNTGMRDAKSIADDWRNRCSLQAVTSKLLSLVEGGPAR
jgi:glycosyltransferase involved in cell wall biosynthesis